MRPVIVGVQIKQDRPAECQHGHLFCPQCREVTPHIAFRITDGPVQVECGRCDGWRQTPSNVMPMNGNVQLIQFVPAQYFDWTGDEVYGEEFVDDSEEEEVESFEKIRSNKLPYKVYQAKLATKRSK